MLFVFVMSLLVCILVSLTESEEVAGSYSVLSYGLTVDNFCNALGLECILVPSL